MDKTLEEVQTDFDNILEDLQVLYGKANAGEDVDADELALKIFLASTIATKLEIEYGVPRDEITAKIDSYLDFQGEE